jgi:preprotein translocase subunit SecE
MAQVERANLGFRFPPLVRTFFKRVRRRRRKGFRVNRQYKRQMKKQESRKATAPRPQTRASGAPAKKERTSPRQFFKEVIAELQKVAWPSRQEVVAYSIVVVVSVIVIATLIFGLDYLFTKAVLALFGVDSA